MIVKRDDRGLITETCSVRSDTLEKNRYRCEIKSVVQGDLWILICSDKNNSYKITIKTLHVIEIMKILLIVYSTHVFSYDTCSTVLLRLTENNAMTSN